MWQKDTLMWIRNRTAFAFNMHSGKNSPQLTPALPGLARSLARTDICSGIFAAATSGYAVIAGRSDRLTLNKYTTEPQKIKEEKRQRRSTQARCMYQWVFTAPFTSIYVLPS